MRSCGAFWTMSRRTRTGWPTARARSGSGGARRSAGCTWMEAMRSEDAPSNDYWKIMDNSFTGYNQEDEQTVQRWLDS